MGDGKVAARAAARTRRAAARGALGGRATALLADQFFRHIEVPAKAVIAGYAAIGSEADPSEIMARAAALGHGLALPCVEAPGAPLRFRRWKAGDALVDGAHGTRQPAPEAEVATPGLVLLPLLAFDKAGRRLGYGGGYYDRTLQVLRAKRCLLAVGLAFSAQEAEELPEDEGDQRLDWIVTENGAVRFAGKS